MFTSILRKANLGFAVATIIGLCPLESLAGAWVQKPDDLLYITTQSSYFSHAYFDSKGNRTPQPRFVKAESNHYLEYGVDDTLTIGSNLFVQYLRQETTTSHRFAGGSSYTTRDIESNYGLGDSELFIKQHMLSVSDFTIALEPLVKLPSMYRYDSLPRAGSDNYDAELSLLAGYGFDFDGAHHFVDTRVGYRHRFDEQLSDQFKLDAKLGYSVAPQWQIIPAVSVTWAQSSPDHPIFTESGQNDYDLIKLECALLYNIDEKTYIQFGTFDHVMGRNAGEGYGFMVSTGWHY